jgi:dienelactone hydrolase
MALAVALAACSDGGGADDSADDSADGAAGSTTTAPTTTVAPLDRTYQSAQTSFAVVDDERTTPAVAAAGLAEQPTRTVDVTVVFPAEGGEPAEGPFPLVVFAHGWNGRGDNFVALAEGWAEQGYVVALPTFPLSREGIAFSDDYVNQPADITAVIDSLVEGADEPALAGLVDPERVALGGHSLGSATVFRAAYNACCTDERIDATFPVSGGPFDVADGGYEQWPSTPMLLVHGVLDPLVTIDVGDSVFELVQAPVRYLRMDEADHNSVFTGDNGALFGASVLAFLDATLGGDDTGFERLATLVDESGIAELRERAGA